MDFEEKKICRFFIEKNIQATHTGTRIFEIQV